MFNTFYPSRVDAPLPEPFYPMQLKTVQVSTDDGRTCLRVVSSVSKDDPNAGLSYADFDLDVLDFASLNALKLKSPLPPLSPDSLSVASSIMRIPENVWSALTRPSSAPAAPAAPAAPTAPAAPAAASAE